MTFQLFPICNNSLVTVRCQSVQYIQESIASYTIHDWFLVLWFSGVFI